MKTVVLLFHPNFEASRINKAFEQAIADDVNVRHMYELYPNNQVDVMTEQTTLTEADRIVLQFPMYWYNSPSLLKEWQDKVLTYGWAYGSTGKLYMAKNCCWLCPPAHLTILMKPVCILLPNCFVRFKLWLNSAA